MSGLGVLILAAGKGVRMRSKRAKVLHPVGGRPMLAYVVEAARRLRPERLALVVGHQGEQVEAAFSDIPCIHQKELLGTAHSALGAEEVYSNFKGDLTILCGDTPLIRTSTLSRLVRRHRATRADLSLLYMRREDPFGYGRLIFGGDGRLVRIVEEIDATPAERAIKETNAGIYVVGCPMIFDYLKKVKLSQRKGEYFLPDVVEILAQDRKKVVAVAATDPDELMGINSRAELAQADALMRRSKVRELMAAGVTIIDPDRTYIEAAVKVGRDTVIHPNVHLMGESRIGPECLIEPNCFIADTRIARGVTIRAGSVIRGGAIGPRALIGPMAHLRPGSVIGPDARIGNFVEVKKSRVGARSKANHLTYLGDSIIGKDVNIGAGTITCNYDGMKKHQTIIEDKVFVGSTVDLVAPVKVGRNALIGAGSTITKDVPPNALAVARGKQVNIKGWRLRRR